MIAYNNIWLYNRHVQAQADEALAEQCIDRATHEAIYKKHEVKFYTPNFFVRIGLGILTFIIVLFAGLLLALMSDIRNPGALLVFIGMACYALAEIFVNSKAHYNSGVDNMLVWSTAVCLWAGIVFAARLEEGANAGISFLAMLICLALAIRFADTLMSIAAALAFLCFAFFSYQHVGAIAKATTPFVMILLFGALYYVANRALRSRATLLYHNCLLCVSVVALVAFYASGNYYVVSEVGNQMAESYPERPAPLPMGWFFWLWTFVVPLVYIGFGIRKKNITLIRVGIPLIAVAVLTFRYYHHIMAPGMAMMIGGMVLFVVSYALINHLREPKGGFTFRPDSYVKDTPDIGKLITNELINTAGTVEAKPTPKPNDWGDQ